MPQAATYNEPAPIEENFVIQQGITMLERQFQAIGMDNQPVNLTGYTIEAQARQNAEDANGVVIDLNPDFVDASVGIWRFPAKTPADTAALTLGEYHYDVVLIDSNGVRYQPPQIGQIDVVAINTHLP
jgi:hypothetical protein